MIMNLLWLFFAYSFLGWVIETGYAAVKKKHFVNRGMVNGPLLIIYGIGALLMTFGLRGLSGFWLLLFAVIYATVIEWVSGHLIERYYHERWWNYSNRMWNLDGYICLVSSVSKGALGFVALTWGNSLIISAISVFPRFLTNIILIALLVILVIDVLSSVTVIIGKSEKLEQWKQTKSRIAGLTALFDNWITEHINRRIRKAYPEAEAVASKAEENIIFAYGCSFYKIILLFFAGAFLGDITETIFCRLTAGVWMSRSSVVWGPFSIVWGLGIAMVTAMLYKYKDSSDRFLFLIGTLLGGAFEYLCSVFTEVVFGKVFWDYSHIPFNIGGRINLLYCFFWGFAAVVWFKYLYPGLSGLIEKIPMKIGKMMTWFLLVFMCCNIVMTCMAMVRYGEREKGVEAKSSIQVWLDEKFDSERMKQIFPNAIEVKE